MASKLSWIAHLAKQLAQAKSPRALKRCVSEEVQARWPGSSLAWGPNQAPGALHLEAGDTALSLEGPAAIALEDPELQGAFLGLLHLWLSSHRIVGKVAALSKKAHEEQRVLRQSLRSKVAPPIAQSDAMKALLHKAARVAPHKTAVLLQGESGTGKEVLAHHVHRSSQRARRAFVAVNCGALPETLLESALFGHEKGAFTSAAQRHRGLFERADGGTLFLDEIAELPLASQVKLLRVLETGWVTRVGGEAPLKVDVRLIAATHRDLEMLVAEGAFRQDLFFRLNVFPLKLPPLRARPEDLRPLCEALLLEISGRLGLPKPALSAGFLRMLEAREWPGNIRELANTLETALILSDGGPLSAPLKQEGTEPPKTFDRGVRALIEEALLACEGRIYGEQGAAQRLGLRPGTLQSKMRKLGIERTAFTTGDAAPQNP